MADLRTDFVDDVLDTSKNLDRVYNIKDKTSGTVISGNVVIEDVTEYTQEGTRFSATNMNETNKAINELNENLIHLNDNLAVLFRPEFRDITADFDSGAFSAHPENYRVGNYIKKGSYLLMLADYDTYYGGYDSYATVSKHHWVAMVFGCDAHVMNSSNTTSGGYNGCSMHTWLKNTIMPTLKTTFGDSHFLSHQKLLSTDSASWAWQTEQYISLPSEAQIYGNCIWSSLGYGTGEAYKHLALFKNKSFMEIFNTGDNLISKTTSRTSHAWLRDVSASSVSTNFCVADYSGAAGSNSAPSSYDAFPLVNLV